MSDEAAVALLGGPLDGKVLNIPNPGPFLQAVYANVRGVVVECVYEDTDQLSTDKRHRLYRYVKAQPFPQENDGA